jgi:hypothetical protein
MLASVGRRRNRTVRRRRDFGNHNIGLSIKLSRVVLHSRSRPRKSAVRRARVDRPVGRGRGTGEQSISRSFDGPNEVVCVWTRDDLCVRSRFVVFSGARRQLRLSAENWVHSSVTRRNSASPREYGSACVVLDISKYSNKCYSAAERTDGTGRQRQRHVRRSAEEETRQRLKMLSARSTHFSNE